MLNTTRISRYQELLQPETAAVRRKTLTATDTGGYSEAWATVATTTARIGPLGSDGEAREMAGRLGYVQGYVVTLPAGTDVQPGDELLIGTRSFTVGGVVRRSYETARRCVCAEVV